MEILCFFAGMAFFYTKSLYSIFFILVLIFLKTDPKIILWFIAAYFWASLHQFIVSDQNMPKEAVIPKAILVGEIYSIPRQSNQKTSFEFALRELDHQPVKARLLLSCFSGCPEIKLNQSWQFEAKIKKATNYANPGSFDYKTWLESHHIRWVGYIRPRTSILIRQNTDKSSLLAKREALGRSLEQVISERKILGIVQALTLGLTEHISQEDWDLFRSTGTTHLLVISGSHIALIAGFVFFFLRYFWAKSMRLSLYRPAPQIAAIGSLLSALAYCLLAGMAVPAQRALIACLFLLLPNFIAYRFSGWQAWRYALFAVLVLEPHALLQPGFYLSFIAVAILMAANQRFPYRGLRQLLILQFACLLGLLPFTLYWYSYGAISGLAANLLAIPLVGYLIVPLSLIVLIVAPICSVSWILVILKPAIYFLLAYLSWIENFSVVNIACYFHHLSSLLGLMLAGSLCFVPIKSFRLASLILFLAVFYKSYPEVKPKDARIDVLDVGQGLAIVVRTNKHVLIYDTGMKFYNGGGDMAELVISPFLRSQGIKKIDKLIISHPDLDHRGGLESLEKSYPIGELIVDKVAFYKRGSSCHLYPPWNWDGVNFKFFPIKQNFRDKNNSSCVLKISNKVGSALFTGDIEALAEKYLAKFYASKLAAKVLIVAHHGSKTSSRAYFIKQVAPNYAIISAGLDNRYHFPHAQTLSTLSNEQIKIFNTAECGMASFSLNKENKGISCYR